VSLHLGDQLSLPDNSAILKVRNDQDAFIDDLQRAAGWNGWAAGTASTAALVSGVVALSEVFR
jgi:hypothetical protein